MQPIVTHAGRKTRRGIGQSQSIIVSEVGGGARRILNVRAVNGICTVSRILSRFVVAHKPIVYCMLHGTNACSKSGLSRIAPVFVSIPRDAAPAKRMPLLTISRMPNGTRCAKRPDIAAVTVVASALQTSLLLTISRHTPSRAATRCTTFSRRVAPAIPVKRTAPSLSLCSPSSSCHRRTPPPINQEVPSCP